MKDTRKSKPEPQSEDKQTNDKSSPSLPNSLKLKAPNGANRQQNMASILQRLPLIKQINSTQDSTRELQTTWLFWCQQIQKKHGSVALNLCKDASLVSQKQNVLTIACLNTGVAALIKHQQTSLLSALHKANFAHIGKIKVQMALPKTPLCAFKSKPNDTQHQKSSRSAPSESAIRSIEATQSRIENEQLLASMQRLAKTLKSTSDS